MSRLTSAQIADVRRMRAEGVPVAEIAAKFGVTTAGIYYHFKPVQKDEAKRPKSTPKPKKPPEPPRKLGRWRVYAADYGWLAEDGSGTGAHFPTWRSAWTFALYRAQAEDREALATAARWGLTKAIGRSA